MSENFEMLADVDVTARDAPEVCRAVVEQFRALGLIVAEPIDACALLCEGYRPGPAVAEMYQLSPREGRFWELVNCGVAPDVGKRFNEWALGPVFQGFYCPACGAAVEPFGEAMGDQVAQSIGEWFNPSGPALVRCPECEAKRSITEWRCKPPLAFSNLSFRFWNWPPLDSRKWKIDIVGIVHETTGHTIVRTYGHF